MLRRALPFPFARHRLSLVLLLRILLIGSVLCAVHPGAAFGSDPKDSPPSDKTASPPAATSPNEAKSTGPTTLERLIYLPYKNLKAVLDREGATVFLPYAQFLKLWENAGAGSSQRPTAPPVSALISKASYSARVENNLVSIDATYQVTALNPTWSEIPLQFGDAAVGKMTCANEKVLLRGTAEGAYSLMLPAAGEYQVQLQLVSRIVASTEGRSFELKCPAVGITTLELAVPAPDQTIEVLPHLVSNAVEADANSTKVQASLGATRTIAARWFPRVSKAPEMESLASVSNLLDVRIADGLVHTDATLTYRILRGQLDQLRIAVPLGHRILDVIAPNLKTWAAVNEANRQLLTVELSSGATKDVPVQILTEHPASAEPMEIAGIDKDGVVHGIHAVGVSRESGTLIVGHGPESTLTIGDQQGLVRIEASMAPEALRRADSSYFKFYTPQFRIQVTTKPVEPRIAVEQRTTLEFRDDEIRLTSNLDYTIERAGVFELQLKIPDGLKIDNVQSDRQKEYNVNAAGDTLTVTLLEKQSGTVSLTVRGRVEHQSDDPEEKIELPVLEPVGVAREEGTILVYAPETMEVITDEKEVVAALPERSDNVPALPNARLASAWTYNRRPVTIPVATVRKPTRLAADVATTVNVKQGITEVSTVLEYSILYSGVDTFRFSVPEPISPKIQVEVIPEDAGPSIKQRTAADPEEGWVTWTVLMQRPVLGRQRFRVKYDLAPENAENSAKVQVQPLRALGVAGEDADEEKIPLARVSGEISIQKDRALSLTAAPKDLEAIDVRELTHLPQDGYLAYRYFKQPVELGLAATKHDVQEVVQTVVSRALVEAVITQENAFTYRSRFLLKSTERQRLTLELPPKSELLGVAVAGKQVTLEKNPGAQTGTDSYFVNVARGSRSDEPFSITVMSRSPADPPENWLRGDLVFAIPRLKGADPSQQGTVAVQQLRLAIWLPERFSLVGSPEFLTLDYPLRIRDAMFGRTNATTNTAALDQWIGDTGNSFFEFPTAGHAYVYKNLGGAEHVKVVWWRTAWMTWFSSGLILILAIVLARTPWENRLFILLLAAFVTALAALQDSDFVLHLLSASRFGLVALVLYWMIDSLARVRGPGISTTPRPVPTGPVLAAVIPPPGVFDTFHQRPQEPRKPD